MSIKPPSDFVRDRSKALSLYQKSKTFGQKPSAFLHIQNTWVAYQFDSAIHTYGSIVMNRWEETDKQGRRTHQYIVECMGYSADEIQEQREAAMRAKLEAEREKGRAIRRAMGRDV